MKNFAREAIKFNLLKFFIMYAAIIYNSYNVLVRVEERPTLDRAIKAGKFYTQISGWFQIANNKEDIELYKSLVNA